MSQQIAARWVQIVAILSLATALLIAAAAHPPFAGGAMLMFDALDWPVDGAAALSKEARLMSAIGGGIFAGMSVMFLLIVAPALKRGDDEIRKHALTALLVWFAVDSSGSFAAGVPGNVVFNALYLAAAAAPLILVRQASHGASMRRHETIG